jgi:hypothetical protein
MVRAIGLALCGAVLSACSSIPGLSGSDSPPAVSLETTPPSAEASFPGGKGCQTPCSLAAPGRNGTYHVGFVLNGYVRQTIPVRVTTQREHWYSSETTTVEPNPVVARLEPVAPPPKAAAKKKRPGPKTATTSSGATSQPAATPPVAGTLAPPPVQR